MNDIKYIEKNNSKGNLITIEGEQDNFFLLSNRTRIKKDIFSQYFTPAQNVPINNVVNENVSFNNDILDPNSFFKTSTNLLNDIKSIDTSRLSDTIDDTAVVRKIQETYQSTTDKPNRQEQTHVLNYTQNTTIPKPQIDPSTYKVFDDDEEAYNAFLNDKPENHIVKNTETIQTVNQTNETNDTVISRKDVSVNYNKTNEINPAEQFFKTFKKNHKVKLTFDITAMISEPSFVRMMSDNLDYDIFKLYTKETLQKLLDNIELLEDDIYKKLYDHVYKDIKKPAKKPIKKQLTSNVKDEHTEIIDDIDNDDVPDDDIIIEDKIVQDTNIKKEINSSKKTKKLK